MSRTMLGILKVGWSQSLWPCFSSLIVLTVCIELYDSHQNFDADAAL